MTLEKIDARPNFEAAPLQDKYSEALKRVLRIAGMVGRELSISQVASTEEMKAEPGVYLLSSSIDSTNYSSIEGVDFNFSRVALSGRADSAHAVLPGNLVVSYSRESGRSRSVTPVVAKDCHKRSFDERFKRVKREVDISLSQKEYGELAYSPIAVAIADPRYDGKGSDPSNYDIVLITKFLPTTTMDNIPWQTGLEPQNVQAAEMASAALGRFNAHIGYHGDAKIKNVAQLPNGQTGMIDFETSHAADTSSPREVMIIVRDDLALLFESLTKRRFFDGEPSSVYGVIQSMIGTYLEHWADKPLAVQESALEEATAIGEHYLAKNLRKASTPTIIAGLAISASASRDLQPK